MRLAPDAQMLLMLPCVVPEVSIGAVSRKDATRLSKLLQGLPRSRLVEWELLRVDTDRRKVSTGEAIWLPTSLRSRIAAVVVGTFTAGSGLASQVEKLLLMKGAPAQVSRISLFIWENGLAWLEIDVRLKFASIDELTASVPVVDSTVLEMADEVLFGIKSPVGMAIDEIRTAIASDMIVRKPFWEVLGSGNGRLARIQGYGSNVLLAQGAESEASVVIDDVEFGLAAQRLSGGAFQDLARFHSSGLFHLAGYEGQVCVLNSELLRGKVLAMWRLAAINFATLELSRATMSEFIHKGALDRYGSTQLRATLAELHSAKDLIQVIGEDAAPVVVCDDDVDKYVYGETWSAWDGQGLAQRVKNMLSIVEGALMSRRIKLDSGVVHVFQTVLFFVTVFTGLQALRDIFQSLTSVGMLSKDLVDPLILLGASLAILAGMGFWMLGKK